jgi:hypothetical protein
MLRKSNIYDKSQNLMEKSKNRHTDFHFIAFNSYLFNKVDIKNLHFLRPLSKCTTLLNYNVSHLEVNEIILIMLYIF